MKLEHFLALGVGAAVLGFAAGMSASRDPQQTLRVARGVLRETARGMQRASLFAAQAREQLGDLWAEVHEEVAGEVDEADFGRASRRAAAAAGGAEAGPHTTAPAGEASSRRPRKRRSPAPKRQPGP